MYGIAFNSVGMCTCFEGKIVIMKSVVIRTIIELAISFCIISGANGINTVNAATESPTVADAVLQSYENKGIVVY